MVKSEIIETIKAYISVLLREGIFVENAFLYGSCLTKTQTADSDIDIIIVTENEDDNLTGKI